MTSWPPHRGDLVYYLGNVFYFQPCGLSPSQCYLYAHRQDIGYPERAVYTPATWTLLQPTQDQINSKFKIVAPPGSHLDLFNVLLDHINDK